MSSKKLFDQFILVSLREEKDGANGIVPYVKDVYPPDHVDPNIPLFCFPEEIDRSYTNFTQGKLSDEMFTFVLTDREGRQLFGFTKRILSPYTPDKQLQQEQQQQQQLQAPRKMIECLCIISHYAWSSTFSNILSIVETRYRVSVDEIHSFLASSLLSVIPAPGDSFTVYIYNNPFTTNPNAPPTTLPVSYQLQRPLSTDKSSLHDGTLKPLIDSLSSQKILYLFISLLFERRVIIYSENIIRVSKFINAIVSLLEPLTWQHIFIPILPRSLLDYCTAPMPFIIGIHSSLFPLIRKKPLSEIIYVDLDKDQVLPLPEDIAIFPSVFMQQLKQCLDLQILDWKKNKHYDNKLIIDTFRKFFVSVLGTYRRFFLKDMDKKKMIFDKVSFIDSQLVTPTKFFTVFCSSQMFERFIAEREEYYFKGITPPGIFEKEVIIYDLKNPVTASINNTLKIKEKEKVKEKTVVGTAVGSGSVSKAVTPTLSRNNLMANTVTPDLKKTQVNNLQVTNVKQNGSSVDRSFLSNLINTATSTVVLPIPKSMLHNNNNNNNNMNNSGGMSRSKTMTASDLAVLNNSSNNTLNVANNNNNNNSISKPNSIAKSSSTSFTMGSPSSPSLEPQRGILKTSVSHHKSLSDLANGILDSATHVAQHIKPNIHLHSNQYQQQHLSSQTVQSSSTQPKSSLISTFTTKNRSSSIGTNNNNGSTLQMNGQGGSLKSKLTMTAPQRQFIPMKSVPFILLHTKFHPEDTSRLSVEEIHEFLFPPPPRPQPTSAVPQIIKTSPENTRVANNFSEQGYVVVKNNNNNNNLSASVDKNAIFKIPEVPQNFAISVPFKKSANGSGNSISNSGGGLTNSASSHNLSGLALPGNILPPPPTTIKKGHHRSQSTYTPSRASNLLSSNESYDLHTSSGVTSSGSYNTLNTSNSSNSSVGNNPSLTTNISRPESHIQTINEVNEAMSPPVTNTTNALKNSASVPQPEIPPLTSPITTNGPISTSAIDLSSNNPLPPPITSSGAAAAITPIGSIPHSTSNSNFFDNNPLETHIQSDINTLAMSNNSNSAATESKFFDECWKPTSTPQDVLSSSGNLQNNSTNPNTSNLMINQSGSEFFSPFVSPPPGSSSAYSSVQNNNNNNQQQQPPVSQQPPIILNNSNNLNNSSSFYSATSSSNLSNSSILPPLVHNQSSIPQASFHSSNFYDQTPLSHSSTFNDFGPPTPSMPAYHQLANGGINTPTSTLTNSNNNNIGSTNPLPPLQTTYTSPTTQFTNPNPIKPDHNLDEFDLFLSMRKNNQSTNQ